MLNSVGAPSLPPETPSADALKLLRGLVELMVNPKAARELIAELDRAAASAREAMAAMADYRARLVDERRTHDQTLKSEREAQEKQLVGEREKHASAMAARERAMGEREGELEQRLAAAAADADAAARLKTDLEERLSKLRSIAA